ncbi:MAG: PDZ domain-containing protein, partial [Myxococcota bacterium]
LRSQDETGHAVYGPGVRVLALAPGSVAEATGLQPQDIIMKIDGFTVRQVRHARHLLAQIPAETAVTLQLEDGRELTLTPRRESTTQAP